MPEVEKEGAARVLPAPGAGSLATHADQLAGAQEVLFPDRDLRLKGEAGRVNALRFQDADVELVEVEILEMALDVAGPRTQQAPADVQPPLWSTELTSDVPDRPIPVMHRAVGCSVDEPIHLPLPLRDRT